MGNLLGKDNKENAVDGYTHMHVAIRLNRELSVALLPIVRITYTYVG